jgi:DNA-binding PadR family transcriptional regulator
MIGMLDPGRTTGRPWAAPHRDMRDDLLRLMLLREIGDRGPVSGADAMGAVASLACSFDLAAPGFAALHDMRDDGLLDASAERPPRYAITRAGRREAERLAERCWPAIRAAMVELNVCVGCLAPRGPGARGEAVAVSVTRQVGIDGAAAPAREVFDPRRSAGSNVRVTRRSPGARSAPQ